MTYANKRIVLEIALIAILTSILTIQEFVLMLLPNIQLTVFLIVLYSKTLGLKRTCIICFLHVLIDNLLMGSLNILYFPTMLLGWLIIPITLNTVFKKCESALSLALLSILFALIYSWCFIIPSVIIARASFSAYLIADIPFEILLALSSFLTVLWLYEPLKKIINKINPLNNLS